MTDPSTALAVYGTLRRGERNAALLREAPYLGLGRIAGRMWEMPETADREYAYPSLVIPDAPPDGAPDPDPSATGGPVGSSVVVELYDLTDPDLLAAVDALEAFDPDDVAGSEYVRRLVDIVDGPVGEAWIYVYNGPPEAKGAPIPDGDWVAHRARTVGQGA
jgi:gamma-glutamylcyclotransferase (GGCT)/AIG2-like uncharacterized protein YtfP